MTKYGNRQIERDDRATSVGEFETNRWATDLGGIERRRDMATAFRQAASTVNLRTVAAERPGLPVAFCFAVTLAVMGLVGLNLSASLALAAVLIVGCGLNVLLANRPLTVLEAGFLGAAHIAGAVAITLA